MKNAMDSVTKFDLIILQGDIDAKFEQYDEKNRSYRDQVLTGLDKVMKELETIREETTVGNHQLSEKVHEHERRIIKLETPSH